MAEPKDMTPLTGSEPEELGAVSSPGKEANAPTDIHPPNSEVNEPEPTKMSCPVNEDGAEAFSPRADDSVERESTVPMKRSLSHLSEEEEPLQKKNKSPPATPPKPEDDAVPQKFPSPPEQAATDFDKETWQGFCEIESEPAYFSTILRKIGVQGVTVRELPMLEPDAISSLPQPIFGLVMLFRHREFNKENQTDTCPSNVWFANQMPAQNSCATLAMIHALLNLDPAAQDGMDLDIDIGEHMRQFKDFTKDFTPYQRGEAFASWTYVKKIHNSFAKKMDMLENDRYVAHKAKKATTTPASRARPSSPESDDSAQNFENNAHHYIAFVPINGTVWKLDGMDMQPTAMGTYDTPETWIPAISERVNDLMYASGDDDYSLFALSQSPLPLLRRRICVADNTLKKVDARLTTLAPTWRDFVPDDDRDPPSPSFLSGFTQEQRQLPKHAVPAPIAAAIEDEDLSALLKRRADLVSEMRNLVGDFVTEEAEEAEEMAAGEARTWDYGPAIRAWVEMLAENGYLAAKAADFPLL